jgi:hypothetical protein
MINKNVTITNIENDPLNPRDVFSMRIGKTKNNLIYT